MWPKNRPPYPKIRTDDRPRWNSVLQCNESVFNKNNQPYPRGNIDQYHYQYHMFHYKSLHPQLQQIFKMFINTFGRAEDHSDDVLYIERFLFLTPELFIKLCKWLTQHANKQIYQPYWQHSNINISKYFILKSRKVEKWKKKTWDNIRGEVACEYYFAHFWNDKQLEQWRISYLARHPHSAFHSTITVDDSQASITQAIIQMINNSQESFETAHKIGSLFIWGRVEWTNNSPGEVMYCPGIVWIYFKLPRTMFCFGNIPRWERTGNIKSGTLSKLLPKLPDPCVSLQEIESHISSENQNFFHVLRDMILRCVCNMIVFSHRIPGLRIRNPGICLLCLIICFLCFFYCFVYNNRLKLRMNC